MYIHCTVHIWKQQEPIYSSMHKNARPIVVSELGARYFEIVKSIYKVLPFS